MHTVHLRVLCGENVLSLGRLSKENAIHDVHTDRACERVEQGVGCGCLTRISNEGVFFATGLKPLFFKLRVAQEGDNVDNLQVNIRFE